MFPQRAVVTPRSTWAAIPATRLTRLDPSPPPNSPASLSSPVSSHLGLLDPATGQKVIRVVQPAGIIFKGSGFYVNDSKSASRSSVNNTANGHKDHKEKSETKTETKTETKKESAPTQAAAD